MTPFGYTVLGFGSGGEGSISQEIPLGSEVVAASSEAQYCRVAYDPINANKFVMAYQDEGNSTYGTAVVGTVSGSSISFGTPVVFNSDGTTYVDIAFDQVTANKIVCIYRDGGSTSPTEAGTAIVGTISGTSLSFGTEVMYDSACGNTKAMKVKFDPNNANKCVIVYRPALCAKGTAIVGTVSGTGISFGTPVDFWSTSSSDNDVSFDPNTANKFVVTYKDSGNSSYGTGIVGTLSGTSISFGTGVVFESAGIGDVNVVSDLNNANKYGISYMDFGNSEYGTAIVATVSGTSISFGTPVVFESAAMGNIGMSWDENLEKCIIVYEDKGNSDYGTVVIGTISGTSISFASAIVIVSSDTNYITCSFDPNTSGKFVCGYEDVDNSGYPTAILGQLSTA